MKIKEKIISLIPKTQSMQEIKVPDLKQYLINGYNEIREIKKEKAELEIQLEEMSKNKQLYEGTLVTLDEFRKRDEENQKEIGRLKEKLKNKEDEIYSLNSEVNTYKIKQKDYEAKEKKFDEHIEIAKNSSILVYVKILSQNIKNTKGNLSKEKVLEIIRKTKV